MQLYLYWCAYTVLFLPWCNMCEMWTIKIVLLVIWWRKTLHVFDMITYINSMVQQDFGNNEISFFMFGVNIITSWRHAMKQCPCYRPFVRAIPQTLWCSFDVSLKNCWINIQVAGYLITWCSWEGCCNYIQYCTVLAEYRDRDKPYPMAIW